MVLAWKEIIEEKDALNLDIAQGKQAVTKRDQSDKTVVKLLNQAYRRLILPKQEDPKDAIECIPNKLPNGDDSPIARAARKLHNEDCLIEVYSPQRLRMEVLDLYIWNDTAHIDLKQLWQYLTSYIYMPRLQSAAVLLGAVKDGVVAIDDTAGFAYAEGWDGSKYINPVRLKHVEPSISDRCLVVRSDVALKQIEAEEQAKKASETTVIYKPDTAPSGGGTPPPPPPPDRKTVLKRFYGSVSLDPLRVNRDASDIANEIVQHLTKLNGAEVEISIDIVTRFPEGFPDDVVRTVSENCRTLKFKDHGFEED